MLIPSPRHTAADLALWAELERADALHGLAVEASGRWRRAVEEMRRFAAAGPCYVAVSWGKDSVVLAHLHELSGLRLPVVNVAQHGPQYDSDCPRVRDAFLARFPGTDYREIVVTSDNRAQRDRDKAAGLEEGIRRAQQLIGTARYVGGLRADEGGGRKQRMWRGLTWGDSCQPIGRWSGADVFGWLARHDLPTHPVYAMLGGGRYERDRLRVSIIGGAKGRGGQRDPHEREYYGDVLRRLQAGR